jgi:diguanylate cyclase (GGDEF)-like protein
LAAYIVVVFLNLKTGWIFSFDSQAQYIRGPLNQLSLMVAIFQISVAITAIWVERQYLDQTFFKVILWLPPLSFAIIILQLLFPEIILTGTAIMIAILSVYLNFQTRRISIDNLTQFPNRESFISNLEHIRRFNRKAVVMLVSLNDFKLVNDTYGQKRGDQYLRVIAQGLQDLVPHGQLYRYGGDEFAIIDDVKHGKNLAESVLDRFSSSWYVEGVSTRIKASLALMELPYKADRVAEPLTLLDHAIRTAKNRGKGQLIYCDSMLLKTIQRKQKLSDRLLKAISHDSLSLEFQPIYNLRTRKVEMIEALLRWEDSQLGKVSPSEFIPLAEELGIIGELGRWVLEQVCMLIDEFRSSNMVLPSISINFSGLQFADSQVVQDILHTIERFVIPPEAIHIELTESTFIGASFKEALSVMQPLIEHGIGFHLDDFGSGYSNLS